MIKFQQKLVDTTNLETLTTERVSEAHEQARQQAIAHNASLQKMTIETKAATFALEGLKVVSNMFIGMAITWAISKIVKGTMNFINSAENAKKAAEEASSKIQDLNEKIQDTNKFVEANIDKYAEYAKRNSYFKTDQDATFMSLKHGYIGNN